MNLSEYVTRPAKIGDMQAHDFCLLFQISITCTFMYYYAMAMQFSALSTHLIGFMMQVTKCKYSFPELRYDL